MADRTMPPIPALDWINLALAIWLFISPWIFGGAEEAMPTGQGAVQVGNAVAAAWNAWIVGVLVAVVAIAALANFARWEEWINLILGLWLIISPWVLGFSTLPGATWNAVIVGLLIAIFAVWEVMAARRAGTPGSSRP